MTSPAKTRSTADVSLARTKRNRRAIALLRRWKEANDDEQRETWEFLKKALDEDRPSGRKLFPPS